ncbi:DUF6691 family protein [Marilutibacter chinensis]|uniref:YeeE/YedE family protein n=1 Tax=Marilutibacter chinensis TaxID=2912247 RepID=A0ABS9HWU7_9GAMM|nr:DUF6691 family protein [Lysobacter chinensis]MCF7223356.1 YeeE/YedE family protein [Lysobacter chinensis]
MKRAAHAAIAGLLFGLGLAMSGMTNPDKVLNFLDFAGQWDASLALVMGGALAVALPGYRWVRHRDHAVCGNPLSVAGIDLRLLGGSALFGIGWGLAGYCPGPALAGLAHGSIDAVVFVAAMLAGSRLARPLASQI